LTFKGDPDRGSAEDHEEKLRKAAGAVLRDERDLFVFDGGEGGGFAVPGIVHKEGMRAGGDLFQDGLAIEEFRDGFTIEGDDDFALLGVLGGVAMDGECGGHEGSGRIVQPKLAENSKEFLRSAARLLHSFTVGRMNLERQWIMPYSFLTMHARFQGYERNRSKARWRAEESWSSWPKAKKGSSGRSFQEEP